MSNPGTDPTLSGGAGSNTPTGESYNTPTSQPRPGGAPTRTYLNERIVPHLLEGMKTVAKDQPSNPLRMLGEFLIQKSDEIEGGAACKKEPPE